MAWRDRLLTPLIGHSKASAERATRRYLEDIDSSSCLKHLNKAVGQLLNGFDDVNKIFSIYVTTNSRGKRVLNRDSFARYITPKQPENPAVTNCVPLLWRIFSIGAYFPFSASTTASGQVSGPSNEPDIDLEGFRRAFTFLVLRGYELLGAKSDGRPLSTATEKSYSDKVPRLARIIFESMSTLSPQSAPQSQTPQEPLRLQDFKDTIAFTQPIMNENMHHGRATVADREFEAAAHRLLLADHGPAVGGSCAVSKTDLQSLIQLLLLQRVRDRRCKDGLSYYDMYQRSGDIMFSHFVPGIDEASRASEFASAFIAYQFGGSKDAVTWDAFKDWCSECPSFIFHFFQLWASIFSPVTTAPQTSRADSESPLPTSTTNTLCFLNIAQFVSGAQPNYRFHQNEYQLHFDLLASALVANLATTPKLGVEELHETITVSDWFHVILIWGEDLEVEGKGTSRLIVAFTSPPEKVLWRPEGKRTVQYIWRTSAVQLEPELALADGGGMSASIEAGSLKLRSRGVAVKGCTSMKLDLAERVVDIGGLIIGLAGDSSGMRSEGTLVMRMRLTDLKCYRLPGVSSKITRSGDR
ncbi:hypothetical protein LSUE1_G009202 [Lachnellula suecica]|uniref:Uncharacterized protein n=1 Tax=Lachnellula suecica TaxID=602035 RepID=A0A8T9BUR0_9HELO|nr:hypothetical protein LSUE1_G009202 [Lachnellula suecica]